MSEAERVIEAMVDALNTVDPTHEARARRVLRAALEAAGFGERFDAWWLPARADAEMAARLRRDYKGEGYDRMSDESVLRAFGYEPGGFADTWDHVGDARDSYQQIGARLESLFAAAYGTGESDEE